MGNEDKRESYKEILSHGYTDEEILYMGDELFDLPLLKRCGFSLQLHLQVTKFKRDVTMLPKELVEWVVLEKLSILFDMHRTLKVPVEDF